MPKLVSVELENFQTLKKHVVIPISELTLLFGPNGAGKSALFDALSLIKKISSHEWGEEAVDLLNLLKRWARKTNDEEGINVGIGISVQIPNNWNLDTHPDMFRLNKVHMSSLDTDYEDSLSKRTFRIYLEIKRSIYDWNFKTIEISSDLEKILELKNDDENNYLRIYELDWLNLYTLYKNKSFFKSMKYENGYYECPIEWDGGSPRSNQWFRVNYFSKGGNEDRELLEEMGLIGQDVINFIRGILNSEIFHESWPLVEGSRTVPTPSQAMAITPGKTYRNHEGKIFGGHKIENSQLLINLKNSLNAKPNWAHLCKEYAHHKSGAIIEQEFDLSDSIQKINEVLREDLFEGNGYQLTGDVKCLLDIEEVEEAPDYYPSQYPKLVRLYLKDKLQNSVEIEDVGSGIGYVLPVLASLANKGASLIQQPELHLHPKLQSALGSAIVKFIENKTYFSAFTIIETHSEHILLRIMRLVKSARSRENEVISPLTFDKVSILYFEPVADGSTEIRRLRLNPLGELVDRWPGGFFNERFGDYFDE